ncbi:MAG: peptidase, partial [Candidatus Poribacteria bacterium]|nr:peptidase [Candidatus Poribacteria bacterium]
MSGYYRMPTIHGDAMVFVSEDDLWTVSANGGIPRRLTSNLGAANNPRFSPDGSLIAFTGREEGPSETYVIPALGGTAKRLTYQGAAQNVVGWTADGKGVHYTSSAAGPFGHVFELWSVSYAGGAPERCSWGPADRISYGGNGRVVLARHARRDPSWWKRYRGGTAGRLWIDAKGDGQFELLVPANGNFTDPMWVGERVYFLSDHEGVG